MRSLRSTTRSTSSSHRAHERGDRHVAERYRLPCERWGSHRICATLPAQGGGIGKRERMRWAVSLRPPRSRVRGARLLARRREPRRGRAPRAQERRHGAPPRRHIPTTTIRNGAVTVSTPVDCQGRRGIREHASPRSLRCASACGPRSERKEGRGPRPPPAPTPPGELGIAAGVAAGGSRRRSADGSDARRSPQGASRAASAPSPCGRPHVLPWRSSRRGARRRGRPRRRRTSGSR